MAATASAFKPLKDARILIVGMGGLGSPAALALARAGIGSLGIVDPDRVELSNLHRQLLYRDADLGRAKVEVASERLRDAAPGISIVPVEARLDRSNAADLLASFDAIIEGSDSLETKFTVNDFGVLAGKPFVIGAAIRWTGQLFFWNPGAAIGCYRCLFEDPPPPESALSCAEGGIFPPLCGVVGALGAVAALGSLGIEKGPHVPRPGVLYVYEARHGLMRKVNFRRRKDCPACGEAGESKPGNKKQKTKNAK